MCLCQAVPTAQNALLPITWASTPRPLKTEPACPACPVFFSEASPSPQAPTTLQTLEGSCSWSASCVLRHQGSLCPPGGAQRICAAPRLAGGGGRGTRCSVLGWWGSAARLRPSTGSRFIPVLTSAAPSQRHLGAPLLSALAQSLPIIPHPLRKQKALLNVEDKTARWGTHPLELGH